MQTGSLQSGCLHSRLPSQAALSSKRCIASLSGVRPKQDQRGRGRQHRRGQVHVTSVRPALPIALHYLKMFKDMEMCSTRSYTERCAGLVLAVLQVIPQLQGNATDQTPPDLPSYLFKERIVYLVGALPRLAVCHLVLVHAHLADMLHTQSLQTVP